MIPVTCPDQMVINDVALFEPHRMCPSACKRCQRIHDPNFKFQKLGLNKFSYYQQIFLRRTQHKQTCHSHSCSIQNGPGDMLEKNDMLYRCHLQNSKSAKRNRLGRCTCTFLPAAAHDDTVLCAVRVAHTNVGVVTKYFKHFTSFNFK